MKSTPFDIHIHSSATSGYINMGVAAREAFDTERLDLGIIETLFRNHDTHHRHVALAFLGRIISKRDFLRRRLRQEEERRMRLTSYRLLQPRTTASLRNRYLCKVSKRVI